MSIKPVAWMCDGKLNKAGYVSTDKAAIEMAYVVDGDGPLVALIPAIPDTHRVVSVELLRHITGSNETSEFVNAHIEIRAIIEDKPCSQS